MVSTVLALESSCDESAIAIWDRNEGLVYEQVLSQIALHSTFGGVVPGIAIREHLDGFPKLLEALKSNFDINRIDQIAVTVGPGLMGCLGIGLAYAQALKFFLKKPLKGLNHLRGHALSPFMHLWDAKKGIAWEKLCPHLGLLISGGNTLLFLLNHHEGHLSFEILAQTQDDAAGEALDKGARLLGFPYPGGPFIEKTALTGDASIYNFPKAFPNEWKFSFSGLKTSLRYYLEKQTPTWIEPNKASICAAYQSAVVAALTKKIKMAIQRYPIRSLGLSGGVSQNDYLRQCCETICKQKNLPLLLAQKKHCGDNAAMMAFSSLWLQTNSLKVQPNLTLDSDD